MDSVHRRVASALDVDPVEFFKDEPRAASKKTH